ncbi:DegT/DnrJ/EryC1/StrS family aminotransferase [Luteimonas sp. SDU101]|uniref:DegT/DnrJ/EryC1/StrS family aminotransferase n=1 Tax=Luteimonas sp. SDU101 TaxID=3422593 RepID=UPI003EB9D347
MQNASSVPLNSLSRRFKPLHSRIQAAAEKVIASGHYILGPEVEAFQDSFARYCGVSHCVGVANGTDALEIALKAVNAGSGDLVATVANAAMYGTSAISACGAEPVYVDTAPGRGTMDPQALAAILEAHPSIKAIIVTHLYGRLAEIEHIMAAAASRGVAVVEDCAQAHGARDRDGRRAGSFGHVASFSFYPTKNLGALGDGGAVVTRNADIAKRAAQLRQYGWAEKYVNALPSGRNSRLDEIQAAMLNTMLPMLDAWNATRRSIANRYSREIRHSEIAVPPEAGDEYVAHLYVVRTERRDALREHLRVHGIQTDVHYPTPDHRQPCHHGKYDAVCLPVTEQESPTLLTLPCFPELEDAEVVRVIAACNAF